MNKLKKACLKAVDPFFRKGHTHVRIALALHDLRAVWVLPMWWYRMLFWMAMRMVSVKMLKRRADWIIHKIPYHIRFKLA